MKHSAKTVSIRHLHAAVKTALEAAKKKHPEAKFAGGDSSGPIVLPIYVRFPWICGLPPDPWFEGELENVAAFTGTFVASLASNPQISAAARDGKFEPSISVAGNTVAIGFVPSDFALTE